MKLLSPRTVDLLEIAAYIYTADCATIRGDGWDTQTGIERWRRDLRFVVPVRDCSFWGQPGVRDSLQRTLNFLSDDRHEFEFCELTQDRPMQSYLSFGDQDDWPPATAERVILFSGGLDSLTGAIETLRRGNPTVLVTHRAVTTIDKRVRDLVSELKQRYPGQVRHVPVWVNKRDGLDREHNQRTRSFLFAAVGVAVAESVRAFGIRFYENGVVSLNLPVADEVIGARASRTTHPLALKMFGDFFSRVVNRPLVFDNPYVFKTKADVIATLADLNEADLIGRTSSCAHLGRFKSKTQWHCGTCSQCIDRRIAVITAGLEAYDLETDYVSDVFLGPRKEGYERNMAVNYVRHVMELYNRGDAELANTFSLQLARASSAFEIPRKAAEAFLELHKRHAVAAYRVIEQQLARNSGRLLRGDLEPTSMLALVAGQEHRRASWHRFADHITRLLSAGVPVACERIKPKDEPHLQQICDGILTSQRPRLAREYPFMRWSSSMTKADWSAEDLDLLVELKYVRTKSDVHPIIEALAADITKYGDNGRRVLYVVYDPTRAIVDDEQFAVPFLERDSTLVRFIR